MVTAENFSQDKLFSRRVIIARAALALAGLLTAGGAVQVQAEYMQAPPADLNRPNSGFREIVLFRNMPRAVAARWPLKVYIPEEVGGFSTKGAFVLFGSFCFFLTAVGVRDEKLAIEINPEKNG